MLELKSESFFKTQELRKTSPSFRQAGIDRQKKYYRRFASKQEQLMIFLKSKSLKTGCTCFGHCRDRQPAAGGLLM
jgi:hypothetical protein